MKKHKTSIIRSLPSMKKKYAFMFSLLCIVISVILPTYSTAVEKHSVKATRSISGTVTSAVNGLPLSMITVNEKGTKNTATNDINGKYKIEVAENSTLVFTGIGFVSREIGVIQQTIINVALAEQVQDLKEVSVVIGYGKQKSTRITSAIAKIKSSDLDERPSSRIDHAMVGKLSGVQVQESSGSPGRGLTVKVRGVSSISNSNAPLYVVDGYPISSGLDNINPNDIESIEVLKDAASAAIYGSRGSSGVVLVTTKSGKNGKAILQFDAYTGLQERFSKVDVLNGKEYIDFAIEERNNSWKLQGGNASDPNSLRSNANYWIDPKWLSDPSSFPDNDWQELISRKAMVQNYQLSASGANDIVKYFISGNYFNQEGIILGTDFKRLSFRSNVETKISSIINLGLNLSVGSTTKNNSDGDSNGRSVSRSTRVAPIIGLNQQTQDGGYYPYHAAFYLNPIAMANEITNRTNGKNILANIYTTINLTKDFHFRSSFGTDYANNLIETFVPNNVNRGVGHVGTAISDNRENYLNENIFSYEMEKGKWNLNAIAGFTYQEEKYKEMNLAKAGFPDDDIRTLNMGTILTSGGSSATAWKMLSFLSRVNTSWDEKYLLTVSVRRDGSSRFGSENKWGWFPAASVGWRISQEDFMKDVGAISELKLRASYGATGNNNISNYASIGALAASNYVLGTSQSVVSGFSPGSFSNTRLGWEKTTTADIGFDLSILQSRISMSFDYYRADVKDLLLNVQIPAISGFSNAIVNIGAIRNTGVELELNTINLQGKFKWNTGFNISHNTNKVLALGRDGAPIYGNLNGYNVTVTKIGAPIGSYYMLEQEGVFMDQNDLDSHPHYRVQNVGDIKYKDVNGDNIIDDNDKTILGSNNPKFFWGLQNNFSYQNFDLSVSMDGQWGNKLLNIGTSEAGQSRGNVDGYWRDRWRSPENPGNGWTPRAAVTANLTTPSSFWLRNASFWRVRTVALGYKVPAGILEKIKAVNGVRIYASVDNVFMHDHYNKNSQTGSWSNTNTIPGVDYDATYPLARTFTLGLNVKF